MNETLEKLAARLKLLFDNPKPVIWVLVAFVVLLIGLFSVSARASELRLEAGSTVLKGETPVLGFAVRWREQGPVRTDWEAGFRLTGSSDEPGRMDSPNSFTLYGQLVDGYRGFEMGLGFAFTNVDNLYHCRFTANLMVGYDGQATKWLWDDRLGLRWVHNSSAGSCRPNTGRDSVLLTWRF